MGVNVFITLDLKNDGILWAPLQTVVTNAEKMIREMITSEVVSVNRESASLIKETRFTTTTDQLCQKYSHEIIIKVSDQRYSVLK